MFLGGRKVFSFCACLLLCEFFKVFFVCVLFVLVVVC